MPAFKIPEGQKPAIATLVKLDPEKMQALLAYLQACGPSLISASAHENLPDSLALDAESAADFVSALASMYLSHESGWLTLGDITQTIADDPDIGVDDEKMPAVEEFLDAMFGLSDSFGLAAKMLRLRYDYANVLSHASIVSDLRPVFSTSVGRPEGFAIVHNLRLKLNPGAEKYVYVALDTPDLKGLEKIIARALEKDRALRATVEEMKIPVYQEGMI